MIEQILLNIGKFIENYTLLLILGIFALLFISVGIQCLLDNRKDKRKSTTQKYREGLIKK